MTAITFPNSPSSGDTHTAGNGIVYTYDGEKWTSIGTNSAGTWTRSGTTVSLTNAGDDLNVDSGTFFVDASSNRVGVATSTPSESLHVGGNVISDGSIKIGSYDGGNGTLINNTATTDVVKATGDVYTVRNTGGGTPTLTLNASGTASFNGAVQAPRLALQPTSDGDAYIQAINQNTGKVVANYFGNGNITLSSDLTSSTNIALNGSDGSASLVGQMLIRYPSVATNPTPIVVSNQAHAFNIYGGRTFQVAGDGEVCIGGSAGNSQTSYTSPNIRLENSGTATFKSIVKSESDSGFRANATAAGQFAFRASYGTEANKVVIKSDGSAEFAGNVQVGGELHSADGIKLDARGILQSSRSGTNPIFQGFTTGSGVSSSQIFADGSATFGGVLTLYGPSSNGNQAVLFNRDGVGTYKTAIDGSTGELVFKGGNASSTVAGLNTHLILKGDGKVGIGTTSPDSRLHVVDSNNNGLRIGYTGNTNYYDAPTHIWRHPSGFAERMRIDSSGNVQVTGAVGNSIIKSSGAEIEFTRAGGSFLTASNASGFLGFQTGGTNERMRIQNNGSIRIIAAGTIATFSTTISTSDSSNSAIEVKAGGTAGTIDSGTLTFRVNPSGNVQNTNNSYGALSDVKLKENIVDASSQWDDLKAIQVRKYNFIEGQTHTQIGVVAQEVELVSPGLVTESPDRDGEGNDLGTTTKSVNYSVLYMKAVKALQEAMARIETLEAEVAALKSV